MAAASGRPAALGEQHWIGIRATAYARPFVEFPDPKWVENEELVAGAAKIKPTYIVWALDMASPLLQTSVAPRTRFKEQVSKLHLLAAMNGT